MTATRARIERKWQAKFERDNRRRDPMRAKLTARGWVRCADRLDGDTVASIIPQRLRYIFAASKRLAQEAWTHYIVNVLMNAWQASESANCYGTDTLKQYISDLHQLGVKRFPPIEAAIRLGMDPWLAVRMAKRGDL